MFERPKGGERAVLVQITFPEFDAEAALAEFNELALSAEAEVVGVVRGARLKPEAKYFVGLGKAEEIRDQVLAIGAELVLINHELSPSQERNLERLFQCRVVDRTGLILDIFAQRAQTFEGKLQVELAQLEHLSTRLVRGWTHLERQKGGIGLRGPGETQLETDRRLLRGRIQSIQKRLKKVRKNRDQGRSARQKAARPTVSLVGYTNAGKSSLFNALTGSEIYAADQLFATLDPTLRKLDIPGAPSVVLVDTVGFIKDLPHQLVDAFRATLEETKEADLLLHVIDVADPKWRDQVHSVEQILEEMNAEGLDRIQVFNKIDLQEGWVSKIDCQAQFCKVWVSAKTGAGLDLLSQAIGQQLFGAMIEESVQLGPHESKRRARLYELNAVMNERELKTGGWQLDIRISKKEKQRLLDDPL